MEIIGNRRKILYSMKSVLLSNNTISFNRLYALFSKKLNFGKFLLIDLESFTSHLYSITWNKIRSFECWSFFLLSATKNLLKVKPRFRVSCPGKHFEENRQKNWLLPQIWESLTVLLQKYSTNSFEYIMKHF